MRQIASSRRTGDDRGSQLAEFAVVLTLLLLLLAGVWDLGSMFRSYITIANAARDGVRYYSRLPCVSSNAADVKTYVVAAVIAEARGSGVSIENSDITLLPDPTNRCPTTQGEILTITVTHPHNMWFTEITGLSDITLSASARMNWFGNDTD